MGQCVNSSQFKNRSVTAQTQLRPSVASLSSAHGALRAAADFLVVHASVVEERLRRLRVGGAGGIRVGQQRLRG